LINLQKKYSVEFDTFLLNSIIDLNILYFLYFDNFDFGNQNFFIKDTKNLLQEYYKQQQQQQQHQQHQQPTFGELIKFLKKKVEWNFWNLSTFKYYENVKFFIKSGHVLSLQLVDEKNNSDQFNFDGDLINLYNTLLFKTNIVTFKIIKNISPSQHGGDGGGDFNKIKRVELVVNAQVNGSSTAEVYSLTISEFSQLVLNPYCEKLQFTFQFNQRKKIDSVDYIIFCLKIFYSSSNNNDNNITRQKNTTKISSSSSTSSSCNDMIYLHFLKKK
jgi:hypothetical protein